MPENSKSLQGALWCDNARPGANHIAEFTPTYILIKA